MYVLFSVRVMGRVSVRVSVTMCNRVRPRQLYNTIIMPKKNNKICDVRTFRYDDFAIKVIEVSVARH